MTHTPGGWHLIEVKSSTSIKPEHLPDVAFQQYVLEQAGLDVAQVSLMHLNRACRAPDLTDLFVLVDVTAESAAMQPAIAAGIVTIRPSALEQAAKYPKIRISLLKNVAITNGFWHNSLDALATTATYCPRSAPV